MSRYPLAIEAALKYVTSGVNDGKRVTSTGVGRPSTKFTAQGIVLSREEFDVYEAMVEFWDVARNLSRDEIMTDEQFVSFMKAAAPLLNKRMIDMALVSDDLKAVRQVAADLADRGYGKAASQININVGMKDIRRGWKEISDGSVIDVSNLITDETDKLEAIDVDA